VVNLKICSICKEELEDDWFGWDSEKCMECVLDTLEIKEETKE
jgi:hypothetical protein